MIRSTKMQARVHGRVQLKDSIEFTSNKSKLVLRNLDSRCQLKWALGVVNWKKNLELLNMFIKLLISY
jgi:hypothetical protein